MNASVFVGTSVDGFIARTNGDLSWLPPGGGEPHGYVEFMATVDALVIGRKTYETVLSFETWPYGEKPVFVLSTSAICAAPLANLPVALFRASALLPEGGKSLRIPEPARSAMAPQLPARSPYHRSVDRGATPARSAQLKRPGRRRHTPPHHDPTSEVL